MGVLYDYFMAPNDNAALTWPDGEECQSWPSISIGRADPEELLAPLHDLLRGGDGSAFSVEMFAEPIGSQDDDVEEWIRKIPTAFVDALAAHAQQPQPDAVQTWAEIYAGMDPDDAIDLLGEFEELIAEGRREGFSMYCWSSL
jgi:hypothetical protein